MDPFGIRAGIRQWRQSAPSRETARGVPSGGLLPPPMRLEGGRRGQGGVRPSCRHVENERSRLLPDCEHAQSELATSGVGYRAVGAGGALARRRSDQAVSSGALRFGNFAASQRVTRRSMTCLVRFPTSMLLTMGPSARHGFPSATDGSEPLQSPLSQASSSPGDFERGPAEVCRDRGGSRIGFHEPPARGHHISSARHLLQNGKVRAGR